MNGNPFPKFKGYPRTPNGVVSDGVPWARIHMSGLGPRRKWIVDRFKWLAGASAAAASGYALFETLPDFGWVYAEPFVCFGVGTTMGYFGLKWLLSTAPIIKLTPDEIRLPGLLGRKLDRNQPHSFRVVPHPNGDEEQLKIEAGAQVPKPIWWPHYKRRYFGNTHRVVLDHPEGRFILKQVYGEDLASRIVQRLDRVTEALDGLAEGHRGRSTSPDADWKPGGGELRDAI